MSEGPYKSCEAAKDTAETFRSVLPPLTDYVIILEVPVIPERMKVLAGVFAQVEGDERNQSGYDGEEVVLQHGASVVRKI